MARVESKSPRVQAQVVTFPNCKLVWINTYMPCDPQKQQFDDTELLESLATVEGIISASSDCEIVWSGDINYDERRDNHFTRTVTAALQRLGLTSVWKDHPVDHTHIHTDGVSTSTIDHFLVSPRLLGLVERGTALQRGDNLSRHSPILLTLRLGELPRREVAAQPPPRRMPAWDSATLEEKMAYREQLHRRLQAVQCPLSMLHCRDPLCRDGSHSEDRDSAVLDILLALVETAYTSLPLTGGVPGRPGGQKEQRDIIPGWSAEVEPFRLISNSCYRAWLAAGKPRQGQEHEAKMRSHAQYRHAVRRVKRSSKLYKARGLFGAAMSGDMELMKELRRLKTGKGEVDELPDTVDGVTGDRQVADQFAQVYSTLYSSAPSEEGMVELQKRILQLMVVGDSLAEVEKMTAEVVKKAVMKMKKHKMDISQGFSSDALLNAPDLLFQLLAITFQDWLTHGTVTRSVLTCAFIPLLKSSLKDPASSGSYRAIAGSSLILKCFEQCVLLLWGDRLHTDTLQFGYKKKCSTGTATWLVQETLQHYLRQGSRPVAVVLDCTAAFDRAKFDILFGRLLDRAVPAIVVRILAFSYKEQLAWVRWGRACTSNTFGIENGTRQGSVASPAFWSVYLDPLFTRLREAGFGCHVGGVYVGVVGYCDDLLLLAPTRDSAQKMLEICESFTAENNIQFSTNEDPVKSKSKVLYVVGPRGGALPRPAPLVLCGRLLPWVERADHLGHALHQDGLMRQDCREKRAKYIDTSVKIREAFYFAHPHEQILATEKYCTALYGSNLWDLSSPEAEMVFAAWRTGHKLAWGVHRGCRSYLLQQVLAPHVTSLRVQILCRFRGFFRSLLDSPSSEVAVVARLAARDVRSSVGANLALIRRETGLDPWAVGPGHLRAALLEADRVEVPPGEEWRIPYLWRLLSERLQAHYSADTETEKRLQELINSLVIN